MQENLAIHLALEAERINQHITARFVCQNGGFCPDTVASLSYIFCFLGASAYPELPGRVDVARHDSCRARPLLYHLRLALTLMLLGFSSRIQVASNHAFNHVAESLNSRGPPRASDSNNSILLGSTRSFRPSKKGSSTPTSGAKQWVQERFPPARRTDDDGLSCEEARRRGSRPSAR
jgi:hypothetical protein